MDCMKNLSRSVGAFIYIEMPCMKVAIHLVLIRFMIQKTRFSPQLMFVAS